MLEQLYELTYEIVVHFYEEYERGVAEGKDPVQHFLAVSRSMGYTLHCLERHSFFKGLPHFTFVRVYTEVALDIIQLLDKKEQQQILRIVLDQVIDDLNRDFKKETNIYVRDMVAEALLKLQDEE